MSQKPYVVGQWSLSADRDSPVTDEQTVTQRRTVTTVPLLPARHVTTTLLSLIPVTTNRRFHAQTCGSSRRYSRMDGVPRLPHSLLTGVLTSLLVHSSTGHIGGRSLTGNSVVLSELHVVAIREYALGTDGRFGGSALDQRWKAVFERLIQLVVVKHGRVVRDGLYLLDMYCALSGHRSNGILCRGMFCHYESHCLTQYKSRYHTGESCQSVSG